MSVLPELDRGQRVGVAVVNDTPRRGGAGGKLHGFSNGGCICRV